MQIFIFVVCAIGAASAGWNPFHHHYPEHISEIHNGVPVETPEVQHAKAAHFEAFSKATSHPDYHHEPFDLTQHDDHDFNDHGHGYSSHHLSEPHHDHHDDFEHHSHSHHHTVPAYQTSHHHPGVDTHGKPLDTPEVEQAKAHHFAAHQEALARLGPYKHSHSHEEHEQFDDHEHHLNKREIYGSWEHEHVPLISHDDFHHAGGASLHASSDHHTHEYTVHQTHAPVYGHHHHSHEIPLIDHDGKPLDTAEVEHAKALHFAAHEEAKHHHIFGHNHAGPIDTPEVQHAKAEHYAAHAHAAAHSHQHHHHF